MYVRTAAIVFRIDQNIGKLQRMSSDAGMCEVYGRIFWSYDGCYSVFVRKKGSFPHMFQSDGNNGIGLGYTGSRDYGIHKSQKAGNRILRRAGFI